MISYFVLMIVCGPLGRLMHAGLHVDPPVFKMT